jgi:hypothetical protein
VWQWIVTTPAALMKIPADKVGVMPEEIELLDLWPER